jgi:cation diffusion facilitator family transporter
MDQICSGENWRINHLKKELQNLALQRWVALISVLLLVIKLTAYYMTASVSILTDALESIVNVAAGFIGLYSLYVAAKPRDKEHPYGHGKVEFISAAVEGSLIGSAGAIILYKAIKSLIEPVQLKELDYGLWLVAITALINFILGLICLRTGRKNNSPALIASGKHLHSDTLSTVGIIVGLVLVIVTDIVWIDSAVAILFGIFIIVTAYRIIRKSVAGIMDEADVELLQKMVSVINSRRRENWIDLHNLRVIKYGAVLHVDCHLTLPWYLTVLEAHKEIDELAGLIRNEFGESLEIFVHSDACMPPHQCRICIKSDCHVRQNDFEKRIDWTFENVSQNKKHELE